MSNTSQPSHFNKLLSALSAVGVQMKAAKLANDAKNADQSNQENNNGDVPALKSEQAARLLAPFRAYRQGGNFGALNCVGTSTCDPCKFNVLLTDGCVFLIINNRFYRVSSITQTTVLNPAVATIPATFIPPIVQSFTSAFDLGNLLNFLTTFGLTPICTFNQDQCNECLVNSPMNSFDLSFTESETLCPGTPTITTLTGDDYLIIFLAFSAALDEIFLALCSENTALEIVTAINAITLALAQSIGAIVNAITGVDGDPFYTTTLHIDLCDTGKLVKVLEAPCPKPLPCEDDCKSQSSECDECDVTDCKKDCSICDSVKLKKPKKCKTSLFSDSGSYKSKKNKNKKKKN